MTKSFVIRRIYRNNPTLVFRYCILEIVFKEVEGESVEAPSSKSVGILAISLCTVLILGIIVLDTMELVAAIYTWIKSSAWTNFTDRRKYTITD